MCGINGLFSTGNSLPGNSAELIQRMNNVLVHRGPDDEGCYVNLSAGIALGHRRLSIIDLSASGHQPMIDEAQNSMVFNGEIYNYREVKKQLSDIEFRSNSDTEVLMKLYDKKGHDALPLLNGMFAFAFYNHKKKELQLARDRVGKKPLYFINSNGIFAFASEIRALLTLPWVKAEPDNEAIYNFLTFNQLDAPQTMFRGIQKMAPAECITVTSSGIKERKQYWQINYSDHSGYSENELSDQVFNELKKAVDYRMVSDVPVGAFLSGGVDSSAVVALMRAASNSDVKTYSVGFEGQPDYDERIYAEKISKQFNTQHFEKIVSPSDIANLLPEIAAIFDEPLADATCIPIYFISKLARENGTVVVQTGDGADEIFAGYRGWKKYQQWYPWFHKLSSLPSFMLRPVAALAGSNSEESAKSEIISRAVNQQEFFWGGAKAFKEHTKKNFLESSWLKGLDDPDSYNVIKKYRIEFYGLQKKFPWLNDTDWMCYLGFKFQVPSKYLHRMDRLGMANSIEIRSPFLDYNLVNKALSIPSRYKIKNGEPKYILKNSLERILPHEILYRKKMGFCVPLREWAGEIMLDHIEQNMHEFCSNTGIFNESGLKKHVHEIRKGNTSYTNNLWTVYFLMAWFKKWM